MTRMKDRATAAAIGQAVLAALLFGASAPLAKLLLGNVEPIPLAALLYLGSGLGMLPVYALRRAAAPEHQAEAHIARADIPWLAGAVLAGGVAAPIVLLFSLRSTPAATASLLLNFEGVATTLIAALAFREAIGRRVWIAIFCITGASILLSWQAGGAWGLSLGAVGILGACALWGVDNNFTRNVSAKDPATIVTVKGIAAGTFSLLLALLLGNSLPAAAGALGGLLLGGVSYGLSIMLFVRAMRTLGAARTSALFGVAPFAGALLSLALFRDAFSIPALLALPLMAGGAFLLIGEDHSHRHTHDELEHDHLHSHDDQHHTHSHPGLGGVGAHAHPHHHAALSHTHAHTPDIHHRHVHSDID